jgi:hypothetical protein
MIAFVFWIGAFVVAEDGRQVWWDAKVETSLDRAPGRKAEWVKVLEATKPEHRVGVAYLVADLPLNDLEGLPTAALVANVELAYQARAAVPWGAGLAEEVFLDAVLPHANVTEPRDPMRAEFFGRYLPLVKGCKTPGEAAQLVNKTVFKDYKVSYNTRRIRTRS